METLINEKTPVIIDNLAECPIGCAVVGYENNGETFVGWNYHVFDFSPNPHPQIFKKENWYEEAAYVAFVGKRTKNSEMKELYRQGIVMAYNTLTDDGTTMKTAEFYEDWKRYFIQTEDECIEEVKRLDQVHNDFYAKTGAPTFDALAQAGYDEKCGNWSAQVFPIGYPKNPQSCDDGKYYVGNFVPCVKK